MTMSTSRCILLDHGHIGDQHIPSFIDSIRLVLYNHEHITLHTTRSWPHWRSTHPFLRRFDSPSTTWSWARHVAYYSIMTTLEINTSLPLSIQFAWYYMIMSTSRCILLIMPTLEINTSLPSLIRSPSTTWPWACHVAYYSIMPTLEINTSLPSSIRSPSTTWSEHVMLHTPRSCPHWRLTHSHSPTGRSVVLQYNIPDN
jgi:hypothetical protein